jgi:hypothetical protein
MRKLGDLMKDLGFREEGSDEVKEAFIKNLIRAAYGTDVSRVDRASRPPKGKAKIEARSAAHANSHRRNAKRASTKSSPGTGKVGEQLTFDLGVEPSTDSIHRKRLG